jgi:hypothetical protein
VLQIYTSKSQNKFYTTSAGCKGIEFIQNKVLNNFGCPTSYFVISFNCRFESINDISVNYAPWYSFFNPYNPNKYEKIDLA